MVAYWGKIYGIILQAILSLRGLSLRGLSLRMVFYVQEIFFFVVGLVGLVVGFLVGLVGLVVGLVVGLSLGYRN